MKKVLLTVGFVAFAAGATAGNFDGMYAGVKLDHAWSSVEYTDKTPAINGDFKTKDTKPKGLEVDLMFGQGFQNGDTVYGFEGHIGRGLSDTKKTWDKFDAANAYDLSIKTRRLWKFGAAGRYGKVFNNALVYGRLGLHANQYESTLSVAATGGGATVSSKKDSFYSFAIAPGFGVEVSVAPGVNARAEYVYEHSLTQHDISNAAGGKVDVNEPRTHILSVGVSFAL